MTKEIDFGDILWKSIAENPIQWGDTILKVKQRSEEERIRFKEQHLNEIKKYDIEQTVKQLDEIYTKSMECV